jgi:hypothetical protein
MERSKKEFLSDIEPQLGNFCLVLVQSGRVNLELWLRLDSLSDNLLMKFSRHDGESLSLDLEGATRFERDRESLAPLATRKHFDRAFELGACVRVEGTLAVTLLFSKEEKFPTS